ncbi:amino acid transporter [Hyaloscypha variabilis F]|uniref:Amino acid transporter n=1 Tax=Hyaloscypha variabilis (strain UAMH 11265 / GT02V1 / F) TaxID=1149755 RepID=A0A2J6R1S2_HYAVF|nr:amino acid transporter [Hyaloscypha variabilis F]
MSKETIHSSDEKVWSDVESNTLVVSDDDALMKATGKVGELKRVYNFWTLCAYQIMIMCSWSCNIILYGTVFDLGGPMALVYGTIVVAVGQTILMCSIAEFSSIWPTAGGQQYYTQALATGKMRPFLSYVVGWAVLFGEISMGSSCSLNSASIIRSFVEVTHPDYVWPSWMTWLVYSIFLIAPYLQNYFPKHLPAMNVLGAVWTVGGGLAWAASFLALAPKQNADFVFKLFLNNSGYESDGWVFIMSLYTPIFGLYGTDGLLHLLEETKNPSYVAPRAVVWSMIFCSLTSWASVLVILFCAGDWEAYMSGSQPYMNWFMDILGSTYGGGMFCAVVTMGINYLVIVGTNTAASRLAWSMARDAALPFSSYFSKISTKFDIPLRALTGVLVIDLLLGLIVLGSDYGFQAVVSCGGICFQVGYAIPIVTLLIRGRKILPPHPNFDLGRFGYAVNIISVAWSALIIVMLFFPMYLPVNLSNLGNMNWSTVVIGAIIVLPGIYWITHARHVYIKEGDSVLVGEGAGPVVEGISRSDTNTAAEAKN